MVRGGGGTMNTYKDIKERCCTGSMELYKDLPLVLEALRLACEHLSYKIAGNGSGTEFEIEYFLSKAGGFNHETK